MRYINGTICALFIFLTITHLIVHPDPDHFICSVLLAAAAGLGGLSTKSELSPLSVRLLAVGSVAIMFVFFAGFFKMVPDFQTVWYRDQIAVESVTLLIAAFTMLPILSEYSCRLKAKCRSADESKNARSPAFFSTHS